MFSRFNDDSYVAAHKYFNAVAFSYKFTKASICKNIFSYK